MPGRLQQQQQFTQDGHLLKAIVRLPKRGPVRKLNKRSSWCQKFLRYLAVNRKRDCGDTACLDNARDQAAGPIAKRSGRNHKDAINFILFKFLDELASTPIRLSNKLLNQITPEAKAVKIG